MHCKFMEYRRTEIYEGGKQNTSNSEDRSVISILTIFMNYRLVTVTLSDQRITCLPYSRIDSTERKQHRYYYYLYGGQQPV